MTLESKAPPTPVVRRKLQNGPLSKGDKWFFRSTSIAANFAFVLVALILAFLLYSSWPALESQGAAFVFGNQWNAENETPIFQLGPMLWGSLLIAFLGVLVATPMAIAASYLIVFLLPKKPAQVATTIIDLLAALPSVVIGLWGVLVFTPVAAHWAELCNRYLSWLPFFQVQDVNNGFLKSPFIAGWIVAVMIVPIITSVTREIFSQLDRDLINGALALGGGQFTILRQVILPTSSGGIIGGVLLGLGRAVGETVAIYYVLTLSMDINWANVVEPHGGAVASWILSHFGEATDLEMKALMAAGLVLFVVTLLVNMLANFIVNRSQPWRQK